MKNKKGFTLIELLVTIALMLSILGIAIVSFINVSNKKKEESWQKVQNEAELAAEEYFNDNAYYKELLSSGSIKVSLGRLVEENYLNVVTNPKTGKTLNKCSYVNVEKDANGEKYTFVEDNESKVCNFDNYFGYEVPGGPKINLEITGTPGKNDWYKSSVSITAKGLTNNNGKIIQAGICKDVNKCSEFAQSVNEDKYVDNTTYKNDTNYVETSYMVVNSSTKMAFKTVKIKVDKTVPTCKSSVNKNPSNTGWYNKNNKPTLTFSATDNLSGIAGDSKYQPEIKEGNKEYTHTFYDNAGNSTDCSYTIKYDGTAPTCPSDWTIKANIKNKNEWCDTNLNGKTDNWYCSNVDVKVTKGKDWSSWSWDGKTYNTNGLINGKITNTYTNERNVGTATLWIKDAVGNVAKCPSKETFGIDKRVPSMRDPVASCYNINGKCNNGSTYYYSHKLTLNDSLSGLAKKYYYNHCYDGANEDQKYLKCGDYATEGSKGDTIKYSSYEDRTSTIQNYTYKKGTESGKYYNLFYKIVDKAGNVIYYRYRMTYSPANKTSSIKLVGSSYK